MLVGGQNEKKIEKVSCKKVKEMNVQDIRSCACFYQCVVTLLVEPETNVEADVKQLA